MRNFVLAWAGIICVYGTASALADRVEFKNGDVLTGKIGEYDGKKLTIKTDKAGEVKVDLKDVKTFSTDEPMTLKLKDGTVIASNVVPAPEGSIGVDQRTITFDQIKVANPPPVKWTGSVVAGAVITRGNSFTEQY